MSDITIGRLRGGYCVSWRENGKRKRYQLKARTRKEAEAEALDVFTQQTWKPNKVATTADCIDAYIAHLADRPTAKTVGYIKGTLCATFGPYRPDQITENLCREYRNGREVYGRATGTIHSELGHLRSALKYAERARLIDNAPHIWRPAKPAPKERYLTRNEIQKIQEGCGSPHIALAVVLMLGTAGRVGAILDLT
ncbi:MAG: hypothetical protein ABJ360_11915 [Roseobacter sp.]